MGASISGVGVFFHSKLVIPAKAEIQKCFAEKAGCPPHIYTGLWAGMTGKTPRPLRYLNEKYLQLSLPCAI